MTDSKMQDRLELIGKVSSRLGAGGSFLDQLQFLMAEVCELLNADTCVVRELKGDVLTILALHGVDEVTVPAVFPANRGLAEKLIQGREPVAIIRAEANPVTSDIHKETLKEPNHFTFISYAGAPMIVQGEVVGVFGVYTITEERKFSHEDMDLLQIIANAAGLSLLNDQIMKKLNAAKPFVRNKILSILREESDDHSESRTHSEFDLDEEEITARNQIEREMRKGDLDLLIHYQPLQKPLVNRIVGYEALLRWNHPRLGVVGPSVFISVAETTGIIRKLGAKIYELIASDLSSIVGESDDLANFVSINISINELSRDKFPETLQKLIERHNISPENIVLEITERIALERYSTAARNLNKLSEIGFPIFIDDFGTGYTSLSHIIYFPINGLKIDRAFMPKNYEDKRRLAIIKSITTMAHDLGILVVAEGIETEQQECIAKELNIDLTQGFGIAEPKPLTLT